MAIQDVTLPVFRSAKTSPSQEPTWNFLMVMFSAFAAGIAKAIKVIAARTPLSILPPVYPCWLEPNRHYNLKSRGPKNPSPAARLWTGRPSPPEALRLSHDCRTNVIEAPYERLRDSSSSRPAIPDFAARPRRSRPARRLTRPAGAHR